MLVKMVLYMYLAGCKHFGREVAVLGRFGAKVWQETVPNDLHTSITITMKCGPPERAWIKNSPF